MKFLLPTLAVMLLSMHQTCHSQDSSRNSFAAIAPGYLTAISKKADGLNNKLDEKMEQILSRLERKQKKLNRKLYKIDSLAAKNIFTEANRRLKTLNQKLQNPQGFTQYIPFLDTLKTSLKFLDRNKELLAEVKGMQDKLDESLSKVQGLESRLQKAEEVRQFLKQQKEFLRDQISRFGFAKQLTKLNTDAYFFSQQITEFKETLKDPEKIERKAIDLLSHTKIFQDFMQKNSMLAQIFPMPENYGTTQALAGLQTRAQVQNTLQQVVSGAGGGSDPMAYVQQQAQAAQTELSQLKEKVNRLGGTKGSGDMIMPDFIPNPEKQKNLLKRLVYGFNIQNSGVTSFLPAISEPALTIGYKFSDKLISGFGFSYKIGLGKDWKHIAVTSQGAGIRSYLEIKAKGSIWATGSFEYNYMQAFTKISQVKNISAWQKSALIGLTKKYNIGKRTGSIQLLYDLLYSRQVPVGQALKFRIGYGF